MKVMNEFYYPSSDGKNKIHAVEWRPEGETSAVLQISHGMIEYILRYDEFARFLSSRGIAVSGHDHLGHGSSAACDDDLGYFARESAPETLVNDIYSLTCILKEKYSGKPVFLLGHSMGSFLARKYLSKHGSGLSGAIIMGTGAIPPLELCFGRFLVKVLKIIRSDRYRSKFIRKLAFGAYNRKITPSRTVSDWISKDTEIVDKYNSDKGCTFLFTLNGYDTLFSTIAEIQRPSSVSIIPKNLPVLFASGAEDPVGDYGKGVKRIFESYAAAGIPCEMKLYENDRHEILNETDREIVFGDIYKWLEDKTNLL